MLKKIAAVVEWVSQTYLRLPKWLRFCLHYGTSPVWLPLLVVGCLLGFVLAGTVCALEELWAEFK